MSNTSAAKNISRRKYLKAFTIVELTIIILVIAILTSISIGAYNTLQKQSRDGKRSASMTILAESLEKYYDENGEYPSCAMLQQDPTTIATNTLVGIDTAVFKAPNAASDITNSIVCSDLTSGQNVYSYIGQNSADCTATACTSFKLAYWSEADKKVVTTTSRHNLANTPDITQPVVVNCPTGFIKVPGNSQFNTSDFCVMKYEAKQASSTVPVSQASGAPWVYINQTDAATYSANVSGCSSCHLITDNEWLTIAHNVLNVASNWSSGSVGTGYIYSGHNDSVPGGALAASTDGDGYSGTGNTSPSNQRRTLKLSNGETIWDLAGNVREWTSGTFGGTFPTPVDSTLDWNSGSLVLNDLSPTFKPSYATSAASAWTSSSGLGQLYTGNGVNTYGLVRGGMWADGSFAGVFNLHLGFNLATPLDTTGFRVAAPAQ